MANINFFALGGLDEKGKNLYCLNIDKSIFLFDAGSAKPERSALGVGTVIPGFDYLVKNKSLIKGLFLSSVVSESAGAISFLLKKLNIKIYSSDVILQVLLSKMNKAHIKINNLSLNYVKPRQIISFGNIQIEPFQTTSFVAQSLGFAIYTSDGTIIYTGNFIFDQYVRRDYVMSLPHLAYIAEKQKVLLLMTPSTTVSESGYSAPNYLVSKYIETPCKNTEGRVIFACFEEDIFKVNEFLNIITSMNNDGPTEVAVLGAPLLHTLKYLKTRKKKFMNIHLSSLNDNPTAKYVLVSGDLELLYAVLIRIAAGSNPHLELGSKDLVILTTPPIKGEELNHAKVLDELARTNAKVLALSSRWINKMSPYYEDIKMMCGIFKPIYFLPVQGLYKELQQAKNAAHDAGVIHNNCIIINNGVEVTWKNGLLSPRRTKIKTSKTYVELAGNNDVEWLVLRERQLLSSDGVIVVGVAVDQKTKAPISQVDVQMRGINYTNATDAKKDSKNSDSKKTVPENIAMHMLKVIEKHQKLVINGGTYDLKAIHKDAGNIIGKFISQKTKKHPLVLIVVTQV